MRRRSPSMLLGSRPRFSRSASRSINSTISRVRLQSNSFTVHLTCSSTSRRSSVVSSGRRKPLYSCISSLARVVNGVCTSTRLPSAFSHRFALAMSARVLAMRTSRFSWLAAIFSRSMVCSSLVSLWSSCLSVACLTSGGRLASLILDVSSRRHASSSLYKISKSSCVRGRMRRSISRRRRASALARAASAASPASAATTAAAVPGNALNTFKIKCPKCKKKLKMTLQMHEDTFRCPEAGCKQKLKVPDAYMHPQPTR
mmetsp:Transcript_30660/g.76284  ORF Transcript_30660/g.76284 Transcript_30660/m.76284 type:complete len:258 (-) Transcript_30660:310-1083(-)